MSLLDKKMWIKFAVFIVVGATIKELLLLLDFDKVSFNIGFVYGLVVMSIWSIVLMVRLMDVHNHEISELFDKEFEEHGMLSFDFMSDYKQPYVETDDNGRMFVAWSENGLERMIDFRLKYGDREIPEPMIDKMLKSI